MPGLRSTPTSVGGAPAARRRDPVLRVTPTAGGPVGPASQAKGWGHPHAGGTVGSGAVSPPDATGHSHGGWAGHVAQSARAGYGVTPTEVGGDRPPSVGRSPASSSPRGWDGRRVRCGVVVFCGPSPPVWAGLPTPRNRKTWRRGHPHEGGPALGDTVSRARARSARAPRCGPRDPSRSPRCCEGTPPLRWDARDARRPSGTTHAGGTRPPAGSAEAGAGATPTGVGRFTGAERASARRDHPHGGGRGGPSAGASEDRRYTPTGVGGGAVRAALARARGPLPRRWAGGTALRPVANDGGPPPRRWGPLSAPRPCASTWGHSHGGGRGPAQAETRGSSASA
jgi:hypothetical protein